MRRSIPLTIVAIVVAGCGSSPAPTVTRSDVLYVSSDGGAVTIVEPDEDAPTFQGRNSVPSLNWSTVVRATRNGNGSTEVEAVGVATGNARWRTYVDGPMRVKVVSTNGLLAALAPRAERDYRKGRTLTEIVVTDGRTGIERGFALHGNYEPEAFSTDGGSLFVIKYLPANNPTSYQVRRLDLATGVAEEVYSVDSELQEVMGGTARVQMASPDGRRLYTLYTLEADGVSRAFIHVLSLDEKWAHCIDLPAGFTVDPERATALAVSPDGNRLFVANSATNTIADVDTEKLAVTNTESVEFGTGERTSAALGGGSKLYLASGDILTAVDLSNFSFVSWAMPAETNGVQIAGSGKALYVGVRGRIAKVDAATGRIVDSFDPPGMTRLSTLGPVVQRVETKRRSSFTCAC